MSGARILLVAAVIAASGPLTGCGSMGDDGYGRSSTPTSPSGSATPAPNGATITITASGVSPRTVTISVTSRVTFVNNSSQPHDMVSNPHPEHTDCPAINEVGFLMPGESRQTGGLSTARTCGFHDHNRDADTSLQGTIVIR